jgi:SAM-dependent methyltransferase
MPAFNALKNTLAETLLDVRDTLLGQRDPLIPPRRLMYDGPHDPQIFRQNGAEFFQYYLQLAALKPSESVLDVGSGMGRKTLPLTRFLSPAGEYHGLEINPQGVQWCREKISPRFANFHFHQIDVYNARYNPAGQVSAAEYRFPFEDARFDFVTLGSVFTHMHPPEVQNYLSEIARVLKPGTGRSLISYFLLNPPARNLIAAGESRFSFAHQLGEQFWVNDSARPEDATAFDEAFIRQIYAEVGLQIQAIHYGSWSGRSEHLSFQDLVLAVKD